jgi:hypothetical protein
VRSFRTYARIRSLTTGTFNRIFKDRITLRLSGAHSVQWISKEHGRGARATVRIRLSSKPFKHTARNKPTSTQALHRISTRFPQRKNSRTADGRTETGFKASGLQSEALNPCASITSGLNTARNGTLFRFAELDFRSMGPFSGHARAEDKKLIKELTLEVLALKVPFGSLLGVSESSPVAGAIQGSNPCQNIRCRTRTRVAEKRPASHRFALGSLFITRPAKKCKP